MEEQRKEFIGDEQNQSELRDYMGLENDEEARKYMEEYGDFIDAGFTDMEDFAAMINAVEEEGWSRELAMTAAKFHNKAGGSPSEMGQRDRENLEYQFRNIIDPEQNMNDDEAGEKVNDMLETLNKYGSIKDKLTRM